MFPEDDLLPISALQHYVFCPRQCALIHVEGIWQENPLTVSGTQLHERLDESGGEARGDLLTARALPLRSLEHGLAGRADAVELHRFPEGPAGAEGGVELPGRSGRWRPFPVETKRGKPKSHDADRVQLCAQALCLEEMLGVPVPAGALFYGTPRRREEVAFDPPLRAATLAAAQGVRDQIASGTTPRAVREPKCDRCSLIDRCLPDLAGRSARAYLDAALAAEETP